MKLYNQVTDKIEEYNVIKTIDGSFYVSKATDELLNGYGYYKVSYSGIPDRKYYTTTTTASIVGNVYITDYIEVELPLDKVHTRMLADLKAYKEGKQDGRPSVDTGLGFFVDGGYRDLQNLQAARDEGSLFCIDASSDYQTITATDWPIIISAVYNNGLAIIQTNATKKADIAALVDVAACVLFEATPYEETVDILDIDGTPTGVTEVVTQYTNNVTNW